MIKFRWFDPFADDLTYLYNRTTEKYTVKRHNMVDWYSMDEATFDARVAKGDYLILEDDGN